MNFCNRFLGVFQAETIHVLTTVVLTKILRSLSAICEVLIDLVTEIKDFKYLTRAGVVRLIGLSIESDIMYIGTLLLPR